MIPAFAPLFTGELAVYGDRFVLAADVPSPSPGRDLRDAVQVSRLLDRFSAQRYPAGDRRAIASLWAKQHFATLLPPFLALALIGKREVDLDLDVIGCTFAPDGVTTQIHLGDIGRPATATDPFARFLPLLDGHLEPLIATLAAASGVSRKVLWSNAGNMFDFIARRVEHAVGRNSATADALALMTTKRLPNGKPNPLFEPVRYHDRGSGQERLRRLCCIRYLLPDLGYCSACPLPAARGCV